MITKPDFFPGLIGAFPPWNSRPLDASFSNTTLKLTLEKIRPGFFRRVQRFVVSLSLSFSVSQSGRDVYAALMNGGGLLSPFRTNAVSHLSRITHSDESES